MRGLIKRAKSSVPFRVVVAYGESNASNFAGALAFSAFLAMFPMILGALSIIGLAIRDPATGAHLQNLVLQAFPASAQPEMQKALHGVKQSAGLIGLVSIGGLIWSASGIFATMEFALTEIFGTKQRDMVRQKLMGFVMMLLLVGALGLTVGANAAAGFLSNYASFAWVLWVVSFLIGAVVMIGLLILLYRFVPNRAFAFREVLPGALLAGVLIEAVSLVFPLYTRYAGSFNTYGAQFGLFFVLATWLFLLSQLLLLGAVYNRFRLGEPVVKGRIASSPWDSHQPKRPVEAIKEKKSETPATKVTNERMATAGLSAESERPPALQRLLLAFFVGVAVAGGAMRRRIGGKRGTA